MFAIYVIINIALLLQAKLVECRHGRIINGDFAEPGEIPYQVSFQVNDMHGCGGSILNKNFVLTAAHCFSESEIALELLKVVAGTADLDNSQNTASKHNVTKILIHENYEENLSWNNDIALVKVDPPFEFNKYIAPAKLPLKDEVYKDDSEAVVSGFGLTSRKNRAMSSKLMKTKVFLVDDAKCKNDIKKMTVRPTNICANNFSEERGFCMGDSGGPLSINQTVVGIVSWSLKQGCAPVEEPQVYTRVSSYIDWISEHIEE